MVFLVAEFAARRFAVKLPVDSDPVTIHPAVPRTSFTLQRAQIGYASFAEALTSEQTDFDFRLIEPASMRGRVVDREALPDPVAGGLAVVVGQRFTVVDVEVIDDQMNCGGVRIILDQMAGNGRELGGRAIRRCKGKVVAGLGFHSAEDIGCAATLVFAVLPRLPARCRC